MKLSERDFDFDKSVGEIRTYLIGYPDYNKDFGIMNFIHDMLYGVAISVSDEYRYADGYEKFKRDLIEELDNQGVGKSG